MLMVGGGDKQMIMLNRDLIGKIGGNMAKQGNYFGREKGNKGPSLGNPLHSTTSSDIESFSATALVA